MKSRPITWLMIIAFAFLCMSPLVSAAPALATDSDYAIEQAVAKIQVIYPYLDAGDHQAIDAARTKLGNLSTDDPIWSPVIAPLITEKLVKEKFGNNKSEAEDAVIAFAQGIATISYSTDADQLQTNLTSFKDFYKGDFQTLFGDDISVKELYDFMVATREELPKVVTAATLYNDIKGQSNAEVIEVISGYTKDAMNKVLAESEYSKLRGKLTAIGWSTDLLIQQQQTLAQSVDPYFKAEYALAKAAVRSQIDVYEEGDTSKKIENSNGTINVGLLEKGESVGYQLILRNVNVSTFVGWKSGNADIVTVDNSTSTIKLTAVKPGETTVYAYRSGEGCTAENDWLVRFQVKVNEPDKITVTEPEYDVSELTESTELTFDENVNNPAIKLAPKSGQAVVPVEVKAIVTDTLNGEKVQIPLTIPFGTTITGPAGWTGTINLPTVKSEPAATPANAEKVNAVIEVGFGDTELTFSKPVRLLIPGQAGKKAVYVRGGKVVAIDKTISADTLEAATKDITGYGDGKIDVNNDLVIWTKHFTQFIAYTAKTVSDSPGGGPGGGGSTGTTITTKGGSVEKYSATIDIPANAVAKTIKVKVEKVRDTSDLTMPQKSKLVGDVLEITKNKSGSFKKPVTITIKYRQSQVDTDKYDLAIYWLNEKTDTWEKLDNIKVDLKNGKVSGEIDHFTKFALIAIEKEEIIDDVVTPTPVVLTDIAGHWAEANIKNLVALEAIAGYPDKTFKPDNTITRAEFAKVLVEAFELETAGGKVFNDTANHWAKDYIAVAAANGIVNGYSDTQFGPDDLITREQMAVMIVKAAKLTAATDETAFADNAKISAWAKGAVATATQNNIIKGYPDNTVKPQGSATRAEAVTVIVLALP
ncbi:MAG: S-layer homology domain-containing protein [Syntrophomonadaceae bacterium]|nr:S-layer homology domain-containing protein [Syntrophomonadaceae bacterium]